MANGLTYALQHRLAMCVPLVLAREEERLVGKGMLASGFNETRLIERRWSMDDLRQIPRR